MPEALLPALPVGGFWLPILIPGDVDAAAIRKDYETFAKGAEAFIRMGLRLMDVKARLPHGQYMAWTRKHLPDLKQAWIQRAKQTAEGVLAMAGIKYLPPVGIWEAEGFPPPLAQLLDGKSARQLISDVHDFNSSDNGPEYQKWCEAEWEKDPELRDEFEPSVRGGYRTYKQVKLAMLGLGSRGGKRPPVDYAELLMRHQRAISQHWQHWDKILEERHEEVHAVAAKFFEGAPLTVLEVVAAGVLREIAANKGGPP